MLGILHPNRAAAWSIPSPAIWIEKPSSIPLTFNPTGRLKMRTMVLSASRKIASRLWKLNKAVLKRYPKMSAWPTAEIPSHIESVKKLETIKTAAVSRSEG